jgi:hypothetical protein
MVSAKKIKINLSWSYQLLKLDTAEPKALGGQVGQKPGRSCKKTRDKHRPMGIHAQI